ncbi:MAG: hypothetical protein F4052_06320 [Dehalococcoidia bacterium]|nr:hypothetical protein [Dehalococcoidia bacterium]
MPFPLSAGAPRLPAGRTVATRPPCAGARPAPLPPPPPVRPRSALSPAPPPRGPAPPPASARPVPLAPPGRRCTRTPAPGASRSARPCRNHGPANPPADSGETAVRTRCSTTRCAVRRARCRSSTNRMKRSQSWMDPENRQFLDTFKRPPI